MEWIDSFGDLLLLFYLYWNTAGKDSECKSPPSRVKNFGKNPNHILDILILEALHLDTLGDM
jgi:hypothetical protein